MTFASDLLAQPDHVRREVIVHELLHLKVPNHGPLFRALLSAHLRTPQVLSDTESLPKGQVGSCDPDMGVVTTEAAVKECSLGRAAAVNGLGADLHSTSVPVEVPRPAGGGEERPRDLEPALVRLSCSRLRTAANS